MLLASFFGVPDKIRTYDLRFRKPLLYPAELREHTVKNIPQKYKKGN